MKKLIVILTLLFVTGFTAKAQTFTAVPGDSMEGTYDVGDWAADYIYLQNNSGSPLTLSFQTITNTMTSIGWDVLLCTSNGCYSYVPAGGSLGTVASGDSANLHLQCGFVGIAGTREIRVRIFETGNPSNADTITFRYHAISTIGVEDHAAADEALSQNFPNPFSGSTSVKYNLSEPGGKMIITDASGKTVSEYLLTGTDGEVTISNLAPGIYFYALYSNEALISRRKMIVQ